MHKHCPKCGPGDFECIASNEHHCEDGRPIVFTCLSCLTRWNVAGQIISATKVEPGLDILLGDRPVILG